MSEEKKVVRKKVTKKEPVEKVETVKNEEVVKQSKKEEKPKQRKLSRDDEVLVMNNTTGRYGYISRTGFSIEMNEYGDTVTLPFGELETMRSSQKRHIEEAFIVILDEDAVKQLRFEKLYENVLDEDGVNEVLQDFERLEKMINKMPKTMRETVGAIATRKFKNGELFDMRVKKVLEDNLKIKIDS